MPGDRQGSLQRTTEPPRQTPPAGNQSSGEAAACGGLLWERAWKCWVAPTWGGLRGLRGTGSPWGSGVCQGVGAAQGAWCSCFRKTALWRPRLQRALQGDGLARWLWWPSSVGGQQHRLWTVGQRCQVSQSEDQLSFPGGEAGRCGYYVDRAEKWGLAGVPARGMVLDLASVDFWVEVRCGVTINCPDVSVDDDHLGLVCWSLGGAA